MSIGLFPRLISLKALLTEAQADLSDFTEQVKCVLTELRVIRRDIEFFSLRHFYTACKNGHVEALAAICFGSQFLRTVQAYMMSRLPAWIDDEGLVDPAYEYDLHTLCAMEEEFNFNSYDESSFLLREVVDLLC